MLSKAIGSAQERLPLKIRDGDWELVDWDPVTGRTVWRYDDGQSVTFRTDTPVDSIIEQNREMANACSPGWGGDYHRVASVPLNVAFGDGLIEAHSHGDDRYVAKYLNDIDNRAWRTKEGRL